ncbi:MAG TPA: hypothetical protein VGC26_08110 [Afipia sp.]
MSFVGQLCALAVDAEMSRHDAIVSSHFSMCLACFIVIPCPDVSSLVINIAFASFIPLQAEAHSSTANKKAGADAGF